MENNPLLDISRTSGRRGSKSVGRFLTKINKANDSTERQLNDIQFLQRIPIYDARAQFKFGDSFGASEPRWRCGRIGDGSCTLYKNKLSAIQSNAI